MRSKFVERDLATLAARQHGVVSRRQLLACGLGTAAIARRIRAGRLHRVHQGVYAVGHTVLGRDGRWMAAVLACGPHAALGYRSAAALWSLRRTDGSLTDVVVATPGGRRRDGIAIHRHPGLTTAERTTHRGIPVTTPARTILDLAAITSDRRLKYALDQAELQELTDYPALDALARAHPGHKGSSRLRATLETYEAGTARTRSGLEIAFLELCDTFGVPRPRVSVELLPGHTVDFLFEQSRLAVETDSWRWHRGRARFEDDRERDAALAAIGYRTLRFTDRQLEHKPQTVARALAAALSTGTVRRPPRARRRHGILGP
jgi:hypothetical protein